MANAKRPRGRPKGSEMDDSAVLMRLAEMLTINPNLRVTTAFKKIVYRPDPAYIRRIQFKWKLCGPALLAEVRSRMATPPSAPSRSGQPASIGLMNAAAASPTMRALGALNGSPTLRAMREYWDSPVMRAMREYQNSPTMQAMREIQNSPAMQAMRELQNSPAMQAMRELQNSPAMRAMREIQNSPAMRAMREIQNSPAMRAIREHQDMMRRLGL